MSAPDDKISNNRRRLFKALSAAPVVITLRPGEAAATASAVQCLAKDTNILAFPNKATECLDGECYATVPAPRYTVIINAAVNPACVDHQLSGAVILKTPGGKYLTTGSTGMDVSDYVNEKGDLIKIRTTAGSDAAFCTDYFGPDTAPGYLTIKADVVKENGSAVGWEYLDASVAADKTPHPDYRGITATCLISVTPEGTATTWTFLRG